MFVPVMDLLGEGLFRSDRRGDFFDDVQRRRQNAEGRGVILARQGDLTRSAAVIGAEDDDDLSRFDRRSRAVPRGGVERPPALVVDVRADDPAHVARAGDRPRGAALAVAREGSEEPGRLGRVNSPGQSRRAEGRAAVLGERPLAGGVEARTIKEQRRVELSQNIGDLIGCHGLTGAQLERRANARDIPFAVAQPEEQGHGGGDQGRVRGDAGRVPHQEELLTAVGDPLELEWSQTRALGKRKFHSAHSLSAEIHLSSVNGALDRSVRWITRFILGRSLRRDQWIDYPVPRGRLAAAATARRWWVRMVVSRSSG